MKRIWLDRNSRSFEGKKNLYMTHQEPFCFTATSWCFPHRRLGTKSLLPIATIELSIESIFGWLKRGNPDGFILLGFDVIVRLLVLNFLVICIFHTISHAFTCYFYNGLACFCTLLLLWIQNRLAGKHGHSIWDAMFVSNMHGTQNMRWTWLHTCPSRFILFLIFYYLNFLKNDRHVGDMCPPKKKTAETHCTFTPISSHFFFFSRPSSSPDS